MTIYQRIKKFSRGTIKSYQTDLTVHDRAACAQMRPGDVALWTCRNHGTHFIWLRQIETDAIDQHTLDGMRNGLNWFDAIAQVFGNEDGALDWYVLECVGKAQHGQVFKVKAGYAREMFLRRVKAIEDAMLRKRAA